jgi:hypothetical protein
MVIVWLLLPQVLLHELLLGYGPVPDTSDASVPVAAWFWPSNYDI